MEKKIVLTDNAVEKIVALWDGTRFALVESKKDKGLASIILLNPREMLKLIKFVEALGEHNDNNNQA